MGEENVKKVHGKVLDQGLWRRKTDQELSELYKDLDIVAGIKKKRLEWIRNIVRMDQGRAVTKILESKPGEAEEVEDLD